MITRLVLELILFVLVARGLTALTLWGVARLSAPRTRSLTSARSNHLKPFLTGYKRSDAFSRGI